VLSLNKRRYGSVKYLVMFKLKDLAEGASKSENAKRVKVYLESLKEKIPQIKSMEVGINLTESDIAYDVVLVSEFDDRETLSIYQKHEEHMKVADQN